MIRRGFVRTIRSRLHNWRFYLPLALILLAGLIHGLIYVYTVPPWQHPDEPGNFELVWLIAYNPEAYQNVTFDPEGRQLIYESLIEHSIFGPNQKDPELDEPTVIVPQLTGGDIPLYFWLAGLPARFFNPEEILKQLYGARLVSLGLFLICLTAAWLTAREFAGENSPIAWMVPAFMALLPGFVNIMTSVNNDVGAACCFSLFVWASIRTIKRGVSWVNMALLVITAALAAAMKFTAVIAVPFILLVVVLGLLRNQKRWIAFAGMAVLCVIAAVVLITPGDALNWQSITGQFTPTRLNTTAPDGDYAFQVDTLQPSLQPRGCGALQFITPDTHKEIKGRSLALGAWVWASEPREGTTPILVEYFGLYQYIQHVQNIQLTKEPTFYSFLFPTTTEAKYLHLRLFVPCNQETTGQVFYDGVVLVQSDELPGGEPVLQSDGTVAWGGDSFRNLVRNPSFEKTSLRLRPAIQKALLERFTNFPGISVILGGLMDWEGMGWYFRQSFDMLFRTFWQSNGWGYTNLRFNNVPILEGKPYSPLWAAFILGALGLLMNMVRCWKSFPFQTLLFLVLVILVVPSIAIFRLMIQLDIWVQFAWARYAFPAVVPIALLLATGWNEWLSGIGRLFKWKRGLHYALFILFMLALDIAAYQSMIQFFQQNGVM